ncbi:MAG TPA: type II secretion system protein N [Sphingomicrobium sp.]|nr:type II secretion system protein N [Sphingomicrobium sp.]
MKIEGFVPFRQRIPFDLYTSLKALILAVLAVLSAQLIWAIATPVGPLGDWRPATPRTLSAEAQSAVLAAVDPFFRLGAPGAEAAAPAGLQLFGTRLGSEGIPGSAILGPPEGDQRSYVVGDEVAPGVKLAAVHFDRVELDRGGVRQVLAMPGTENAPAPAPAGAAIADAFDFKPRMSGGSITGVIVSPGRNSVPFAASGLRQGDVIVAVNGARITSLIDVQQLQAGLAPGARLILTVERGAQTLPIPLNLPANQ